MTTVETQGAVDVRGSLLGNHVLRREDPSLLRGEDDYVDDINVDGLGYVGFVRSPMAHAVIGELHREEACEMDGVIGVWSATELQLPPFQFWPQMSTQFARPPLAVGKVRFVGDIIAVVAARTRAVLADAIEMVWCDLEPLVAVTDPTKALDANAPVLFDELGSNVCFETVSGEDHDPTLDAPLVTEVTMRSQRLAGVPMETNGCLAIPCGDSLTLYVASQNPIVVRDELAPMLGLDHDHLRVIAPAVGGGFGPKSHTYPEFTITARVSMLTGTPLKWTETRSENMVALTHGRGSAMRGRLGLDRDGMIVGLDLDVTGDGGAYPALGGYLVELTRRMSQGVYAVPRHRFRGRAAATNTTPTGAYRGAGRPEAAQLIERLIDAAARQHGFDPIELRHRNFLTADQFPLETHGDASYDSGEYSRALTEAANRAGYHQLRAAQARRRSTGDPRQLGIGIATYVEITAPDGTHGEFGAVQIETDGTVTVRAGTSAHGQGHLTAFSMIVSDTLGVSMDSIRLIQSDTHHIPRGLGTFGSRSMQTAGNAIGVASTEVLAKARTLAANALEAAESDLINDEWGLHVAGVPTVKLTWSEIAQLAEESGPPGGISSLASEIDFDAHQSTFPFGAHIAVVDVDIETGETKLLRHIAVDDCGRIINPMMVTGQQHGGIAQGAAQALFEEVAYDDDGNPITNTLATYCIPSAAEFPMFETHNTVTPSPRNRLGVKGVGESGTIGSTPAIQNAVIDAVAHLGVTHIDMPLTPQKVWEAIRCARPGAEPSTETYEKENVP